MDDVLSRLPDDIVGREAYEAYVQYLGISNSSGYKDWDDLPEQRCQAWVAVARRISAFFVSEAHDA